VATVARVLRSDAQLVEPESSEPEEFEDEPTTKSMAAYA
jgi:hypothetical protein